MAHLLEMPHFGTAEEDVLLTDWFVGEGETFERGDVLAAVETLKASFEVEAHEDGVLLRQLVATGTRIEVRAPLGVVGTGGETLSEAGLDELLAQSSGPGVDRNDGDPRAAPTAVPVAPAAPAGQVIASPVGQVLASPAARRRSREIGVALDTVQGTGPEGMVRVEDVEKAGADRGGDAAGLLDPEFVQLVRADAAAFAALSAELKTHLYRGAGAVLGSNVEFGPGTVLTVERLVLGDGCRFARDCSIDAIEFVAGDLAQFGPRCTVRCRRVELGDNAFFAADVEVGGGGAMDPEAELVVGSHGFIGEHVHLNPCRRLEIGDEVVVSRGAVLMTHSFGGSVLRGHASRFAPVRVGDGCQIGIGASLFPGVEMGPGSVLLSGSSLVTAVPAGRSFAGVPARDLKPAARLPSPVAARDLARQLVREFGRQLGMRSLSVQVEGDEDPLVTVTEGDAVHRLRLCGEYPGPDDDSLHEDVRVFMDVADDLWGALPADVVVVDLSVPRMQGSGGPMTDAWREFLRKRGVRLHPRTWTYPGGWL